MSDTTKETVEIVSLTNEATPSKKYPTDEHGCLKIEDTYTGPVPIKSDTSCKNNTHYESNENGSFLNDERQYTGPIPENSIVSDQKNSSNYTLNEQSTYGSSVDYTGPRPIIDEASTSAKNNVNVEMRPDGTLMDVAGNYTGTKPNESLSAKEALKDYESKEYQKEKEYEELKKYQKSHLRHAGYKYAPTYTVYKP